MRILSHNFAILTRPRLALVGIDHEEARPAIAFLGHERPFESRGEARAASSAQAGVLNFLDYPVRSHGHNILGQMIVATFKRVG